jgi:hypothetical protein
MGVKLNLQLTFYKTGTKIMNNCVYYYHLKKLRRRCTRFTMKLVSLHCGVGDCFIKEMTFQLNGTEWYSYTACSVVAKLLSYTIIHTMRVLIDNNTLITYSQAATPKRQTVIGGTLPLSSISPSKGASHHSLRARPASCRVPSTVSTEISAASAATALTTAESDAGGTTLPADLETASPSATGKHKSFFRRFSIRGLRGNVRQLFKQHSDELELSANGSNNGNGGDQTATLDRFDMFDL